MSNAFSIGNLIILFLYTVYYYFNPLLCIFCNLPIDRSTNHTESRKVVSFFMALFDFDCIMK